MAVKGKRSRTVLPILHFVASPFLQDKSWACAGFCRFHYILISRYKLVPTIHLHSSPSLYNKNQISL
uniref:Uncharacterized protein n=1 Tax=Arundo donax TaxID=35708 RepID=A0A0A8YE19_ARUDO